MPEPSQFNIDRTHPRWWTITFSNPPINMLLADTWLLALLMTSNFDLA